MLYKEDQDVLISVDVFASDRTVRGIIFSLLVKFLTSRENIIPRTFIRKSEAEAAFQNMCFVSFSLESSF